jgi:hypothetical protein
MSRGEGVDGDRRNPLLVAFAAMLGMFTSLIAVVRGWFRRRSDRIVEVNVGGDSLKVTGTTQENQERLVSEWLRRHQEAEDQARQAQEAEPGAEARQAEQVEDQANVRRILEHWDASLTPRPLEAEDLARLRQTLEAVRRQVQGVDSGHQSPASVRVPPETYDDLVRSAWAELVKPGRLLFNPPNKMKLGQTERVEVRLARTLELDAELLEHLRGHGEPQLEEIPTAPLMAVNLTGDGFRIKAYSDEEQAVTQDGITTWEFDVRAIERGQQRLVMCVSLRIPVPGQPLERKSIPVREATIDVQVGVPALVGHFVSGNWQWFIGTAIAIAAVVVAVLALK